ncbi:hypothetical protein JG688_00005413 [Phytophthora aleatoria]|uniref:Uncharacterized protein n=1 Tax=Phytophthora aleatoria TaxID=2496075 RepID=A0A8J5IV43_9STRA|nr:hypothetical protein JG688_00005413 [Phytophthora aleatoria]
MQQFEAQWQDYYRSKRSSDEGKESEEATLLRTRAPVTSSVALDNKYRYQADNTLSTMKLFLTIFFYATAITSPACSTQKLSDDAESTI